ncbi:MAG: YcxB family protein [Oscillospiraceae bacterium]|nr:YcxB family protein [Oscillospiraceae bacterium]
MYQFKFSLNEKDYLEFNKHYLSNDLANRVFSIVFRLVIAIGFLVLVILKSFTDEGFILYYFISYGILGVSLIVFYKPIEMLTVRIIIKITKKRGKLPMGSEVTIIFEEDYIYEITEITETKIKYETIIKLFEGKAIYIYFSSMQAFIIPLSVFESEIQYKEFKDYIHHKINS